MMSIRILALASVALGVALCWPVAPTQPQSLSVGEADPYFPEVRGRNVDGQVYSLPKEFEHPYNLVILAFTQEHQLDVNTWLADARSLTDQYDLGVYELPTLPEFSRVRQWQIDYWMSAGISDPLTRQTTITLYTDVAAMEQALGIPDTDTIQLFLVDRDGQIYWRGQGAYSKPQFEDLSDVVLALRD